MIPTTLRQDAYKLIRAKFLSGELKAGTALSENKLSKELGMSRTPIREAIRQMEMEGIIDYAPRFGAVVRTPDAEELNNMYGVREALEIYAAIQACDSVSPKEIRQLNEYYETMQHIIENFKDSDKEFIDGEELDAFLQADLDFHRVLVSAADNEHLSKIINEQRVLIRVFTATLWRYDEAKLVQANEFHRRLLDALSAGDSDAAHIATSDAMKVAKENALKALEPSSNA
ncbi:MAG: GntR family transcriptional regulator [Gammaproteobacteria bacterium]|nr:GntR family transcriptional regulator [Gammaproteobacteria bacterium]